MWLVDEAQSEEIVTYPVGSAEASTTWFRKWTKSEKFIFLRVFIVYDILSAFDPLNTPTFLAKLQLWVQ